MPSYDYQLALEKLSETEKNRILCLYLTGDTAAMASSFDWDKATAAFGSASAESMRVSLRTSLKKIADKGGKDDANATPAKAKAGGKKRKADEDGDGNDEEPAPKKRGGGRKKKEASAAPGEGDEEDTAPKKRGKGRPKKDAAIKAETGDEEEDTGAGDAE